METLVLKNPLLHVKRLNPTAHGKLYETAVCKRYSYTQSDDEYARWDAHTDKGIPVSVKTLKLGHEINLSSFNYQSSIDKDFILHLGFWLDEPANIIEEYHLYISHAKWRSYFGNLEILEPLKQSLAEVDQTNDEDWTTLCKFYKAHYETDYNPLIKLRFSRNKKNPEKRPCIKCAISAEHFLTIVLDDALELPIKSYKY